MPTGLCSLEVPGGDPSRLSPVSVAPSAYDSVTPVSTLCHHVAFLRINL